ncbi:Hsp20/alpha crystallin family protein [Candidatus Peribacteria bacterium]|nr:Hsp20/alpha crystallin family protein [Candidatus Peribacteria bacterium]
MASSPFHGIFSAFQTAQSAEPEGAPAQKKSTPPKGVGQIAVDIYEIDDYIIIRAPIAGVRLSDLDIEVDDRTLTIRGMRRQGEELPEDRYYLQECFWGEFKRTVTLPMAVDPRKVKATFSKDCILKILIPKEEKIKIVRISEV